MNEKYERILVYFIYFYISTHVYLFISYLKYVYSFHYVCSPSISGTPIYLREITNANEFCDRYPLRITNCDLFFPPNRINDQTRFDGNLHRFIIIIINIIGRLSPFTEGRLKLRFHDSDCIDICSLNG